MRQSVLGIGMAIVAAAAVGYLMWATAGQPLVFAPSEVLGGLWNTYKNHDLNASDGRTIDTTRGSITTSEGESYTMLRAVWMGDQSTFDTSWKWTQNNLKRPNDHLLAWLFGKRSDGSYGILTDQGGMQSASDADTNMALALVFAYARWQDPHYLVEARTIMQDIWKKEVINVNGSPLLAADDLESASTTPTAVIDPSYMSPAAFRVFALVDPSDPWHTLVDTSYVFMAQTMQSSLDAGSSAGLPPDFVRIDKSSGEFLAPAGGNESTNFGFDALRVPYNLALDYQWYGDTRDQKLLAQMGLLSRAYASSGVLDATYTHSGAPAATFQSVAMYGGTLGYFMNDDAAAARAIYQELISRYDPTSNGFVPPLAYYDDNWAWFGIALYNHLLPNLAASLPPSAYHTNS